MKRKDHKNTRIASLITLNNGDPAVQIRFPYRPETVKQVKTLSNRKYYSSDHYWTCNVTTDNLELLKDFGFTLDDLLEQFLIKYSKEVEYVHVTELEPINKIKGFKKKLYPFQAQGVAFIEYNNGRVLIADEMGLGKTIQALAWLQLHPKLRPAVIVVPASLKLNWRREIKQCMTNQRVKILSGTSTATLKGDKIYIINYDIVSHWSDRIISLDPEVIITDECHYFKSNKARRTKAIKKIAKGVSHFIALSGTPIVNRPEEIYNAVKIIEPELFPNWWEYARQFCGLHHNGWGWNSSGATNTKQLHEILTNSIMIRRRKSDVLKELPDKIRSFTPMELNNWEEYNFAENTFIEFVKAYKGREAAVKASGAETLTQIESLKQLAVKGKLNECIKWIKEFLEIEDKLVIFAVHKFVINELMETFGDIAVKIDGSVSTKNRQEAVDQFQTNDATRLFVGNIKAAGVGITLTAASNVAFLELPWTPGEVTQAEDRCHRIGQKDSVTIHYLLAEDTIEEKLANLIDKKRIVLDAVLDGEITDQKSLLTELMDEYLPEN